MNLAGFLIALEALSPVAQNPSNVRLCSDRNGYPISMEIFVANGSYRNDDLIDRAHRCGAGTAECMTAPFLFSLPPGGLTTPGSTNWTVGAFVFSVRPVSDERMTGFSIRGIDGRIATEVTYDRAGYLQAVSIKTGRRRPEVWRVCGGALQLNDVRTLLREAAR